ncbi:nitrous oxide reductase accessory protein NosL [Arcticibacter eurypsychrophilus]|uniref:nitrous oxide reductase accessory protein NosL n=1 Tax=Arcticibacter eurypsychrophilus TaxID=1434752 RepID=UPI00084DBB02|nr:nitrous oxide reductase accessory protein NosL [Arcticibacter eurypsychrophilus]
MKNIRITTEVRALLLICGLGLIAVLFTPIWRIDLDAPQYPEGLQMFIHANKLSGNVDIINGLNHYIGMKTLHADDFVEFKVLPGIIIFYALLFLTVAYFARRKWMYLLFVLFVAFGILAMVDFWRWEYDYGHNLNPNAAIIVPGMAYQPPLIGFKQLLNFGAYSIPATGGFIFIAVGVILLGCVIYEWKKGKTLATKTNILAVSAGFFFLLITGCNTQPLPIQIGKDNCDFCKMTISDNRFGAEIVTKKGKTFKFDDEHCIIGFINLKTVTPQDIAAIYFTNFLHPHDLIKVEDAIFLQSPTLRSPMNGNIAAFNNEDSLINALPKFRGNKISWEDMQK